MAVSKDEFRQAMSRFISGVTVVTSKTEDDRPHGITVSAFSSLSLEPPLVLICIGQKASIHDHLKEGRHFAVNVLAEDQEHLSRQFAAKDDRFKNTRYTEGITGSPLLEGALAHIECRILHAYPGGDHTIFVGEVVAARVADYNPLAYFRSNYVRLESLESRESGESGESL
ncbi:MAG TPA: flavin reductase family protein [Blastocatellia bacterium]|nr:flavin reductase family protein [Blastocatellia bacterium]